MTQDPKPSNVNTLDQPKAGEPKKLTLHPTHLQSEDQAVRKFFGIASAETTIDNLRDPNYWCHHAYRFTKNSIIKIVTEDYTKVWEMIVTDCERTWASVWVYDEKTRASDDVNEADWMKDYKIGSAADGFRVVHKDTGNVLKSGFSTKDLALAYLMDYHKRKAA